MTRTLNGTSDFITISDDNSLDLDNTDDWSVVAWFFPTSFQSNVLMVKLVADPGSERPNDSNYSMTIAISSGDMLFSFVVSASDGMNANQTFVEDTTVLPTDEWHTLGGDYDASSDDILAYVDGIASESRKALNGSGAPGPNNGILKLGNLDGVANLFAEGDLSYVCIWRSKITTDQRLGMAHGVNPFPIDPDNRELLMVLGGNQSPEPDWSGNNNNGTLTGTSKATRAPPMELLENYL